MSEKQYSLKVGESEIKAIFNRMAEQANGSVVMSLGETVVLNTVVMGKHDRTGIDYFPLSAEYEERFYAAGRIKGSRFIKREGKPSDEAILTARVADRSIRPLFDSRLRREVQVVTTTLSFDTQNDPDILAINSASISLLTSDIPWNGPVSAVRVGRIDGQFILNPTYEQRDKSDLDIIVAGTAERINMIEAGADELPEAEMIKALQFGHEAIAKICAWQIEIAKEIGSTKTKVELIGPSDELKTTVNKILNEQLEKVLYIQDKNERANALGALKAELMEKLAEKETNEQDLALASDLFEEEINDIVHKNVLESDKRPDGRKLDEVRQLTSTVGVLPRAHGSAWFIRGTTQALSSVTLGSPGQELYLDSMELTGKKHFMHHYNFPPFSVGEIGRYSGVGRREIGHGSLAERALLPLIPDREKFPYTIRLVSEILSSNGSSSMASVCGSVLAMMDAGIPIKAPAAGIAMGMMTGKNGEYKILTDIQGPEDHHGDMDFKAAGTKNGLTAIQMDVKIDGVTIKMLEDALEQAKKARLHILENMLNTIAEPRKEMSKYAPRITTIQIDPAKIGLLIGPGGKTINGIIDQTGVGIDIQDSGQVFITSSDQTAMDKAIRLISGLTKEVEVGEVYQGKVVKIADFGAFIELTPNQDGLLHISELGPGRVNKVSDVLKMNEIVEVRVKNVDDQGKISLVLKDAPPKNNNYPPNFNRSRDNQPRR